MADGKHHLDPQRVGGVSGVRDKAANPAPRMKRCVRTEGRLLRAAKTLVTTSLLGLGL
jgi:hypothetical protein